MNTKEKSPLPIFIKADKIPGDVSIYEICAAAEEISGPVTIDGAMCISGLWRICPLYEASRIKILANGIQLRGCTVGVESINPYTLRGDDSAGTKLYIGNLPFSYSSEAIKKHLQAAGLTLRSEIVWEKARGPDGSLSDWKTGRRMVWVNVPLKPLNRFMKMGNGFSAVLYYKEMKESRRCNKCLQYGHIAKYCEQEEVCFTCKKPGHKKGDPKCDLGSHEADMSDHLHERSDESEGEEHKNDSGVDDSQTDNAKDKEIKIADENEQSVEKAVDNSDESQSEWETSEEVEEDQHVSENETSLQKPSLSMNVKPTYQENESNMNRLGGNSQNKKKYKKLSKKNKREKAHANSASLKQCQITEFTPGGKRDGSEVFSPDTPTSVHGPVVKKPNVQKETKI